MRISLRKTLIVYTLSIVILVALGVTISTVRTTRRSVIEGNDTHAKDLIRLASTMLASRIADGENVDDLLRQIVKGNCDLAATAIYDTQLRPVAEFSSTDRGVFLPDSKSIGRDGLQSAYRRGHFSVIGPIDYQGSTIGYLGGDFSLKRSTGIVRAAARNAIFVLAICVAAATVLAVLLSLKVTKPIFALIDVAKQISKRQFDFTLRPTRQSEMQLLQDQMQAMAGELQSSTVSKGYVERIFNSMSDGLIVTSMDGTIQSANPMMAHMAGWTDVSLEDRPLGEVIVDQRDLPYHPNETPDQVDREGVDGHCIRTDGGRVPVSITYNPIINEEQELDGFVISVKDITLRKRTEKERDEAIRKAEQANQVKSDFLANMSHELRTPMNSIIGFTRRLITKIGHELKEQHRDALLTVDRNAKHLLGLINDILDLSKIEAGKMKLKVSSFDLTSVVREVLEQTATLTDGRPIEMSGCLCDHAVEMTGDRIKMMQIVTNLVSNAIKYTEQGRVDVRLKRSQTDAKIAVLEVQDTGVGIREEDRALLFQKFSQLDGSTTRQVGGTGLGLFITAQYISMHHGKMTVDSVYGEGSTFRVEFPVADATSDNTVGDNAEQAQSLLAPRQTARPAAELSASKTRNRHLTVLCVDDDADTRQFLQVSLEDFGFRVVTADSFETALTLARACKPDLVCLDMKMPGKGGADLMEAFSIDEDLRQLPVIVVSGVSPDSIGGPIEHGFVAKPINPFQLVNHIHAALASRLERVLIVEDNLDTQQLLADSFGELGTEVRRASNGKEALEILENFTPSAIITDLSMPVMGGVEFLGRIHSDGKFNHIPVIVLTAKSLDDDTQESLGNLCHSVMTKGRDCTSHIVVAALQAAAPAVELAS
jgi:PAS domain S-box-containing protein